MEPKKMTDEEIESLLGGNYAEIYAHIAASKAERKCEGCGVTVSARPHCVTCWEEMKAERDEARSELGKEALLHAERIKEVYALRERVQALEKQLQTMNPIVRAAVDRAERMEVARNVPASPEPSTAECPLIPRCDSETPGVFECRAGCACRTCHPRESSTAEAFATVRERLEHGRDMAYMKDEPRWRSALAALSLLERRVGAVDRVARQLIWASKDGDIGRLAREISAALAGAPTVFTLEEVEKACRAPTWTDDSPTDRGAGFREGFEKALASVLQSLAALRKG